MKFLTSVFDINDLQFLAGLNMKIIKAVGQLAGLAQQTRLRIFRMLVKRGEEGLPDFPGGEEG